MNVKNNQMKYSRWNVSWWGSLYKSSLTLPSPALFVRLQLLQIGQPRWHQVAISMLSRHVEFPQQRRETQIATRIKLTYRSGKATICRSFSGGTVGFPHHHIYLSLTQGIIDLWGIILVVVNEEFVEWIQHIDPNRSKYIPMVSALS